MAPAFPEFWLRIRQVKASNSRSHANSRGEPYINWLPPECPAGFEVTPNTWRIVSPVLPGISAGPGQSRIFDQYVHELPSNVQHHDTTSMFFSTEVDSWYEVPYDCTVRHVREEKEYNRWNRISFTTFQEYLAIHLWMVGHGHGLKQIDSSVNITNSWERLLRPANFWNGVHRKNEPPTCRLAGKLSIILGLIAFTTSLEDMFRMIEGSFRPNNTAEYIPPRMVGEKDGLAIPNHRGLIIDIAYDRAKCKPEDIKSWEDGRNGSILTSHEDYDGRINQTTSTISHVWPVQPSRRYGNHRGNPQNSPYSPSR